VIVIGGARFLFRRGGSAVAQRLGLNLLDLVH